MAAINVGAITSRSLSYYSTSLTSIDKNDSMHAALRTTQSFGRRSTPGIFIYNVH